MRINLIGSFSSKGLSHDAMILRGLLTNVHGESLQIRKVHHAMPQCPEAEINIFIEVINSSLFSYAAKNIWIPNIEWLHKTHLTYLSAVDEIWVKTREAEDILSKLSNNVKYIGWTSIDKIFQTKKNYHKGLVLVGKNMYRNPKPVLQAYLKIKETNASLYSLLPDLVIPYDPESIKFHFPSELQEKITLLPKVLTESEYDDLLKECGLAICTSASEGFGHAINEAMSSGCNLILSNIGPFLELTENRGIFIATKENIEHPTCLGSLTDVSVHDLMLKLEGYVRLAHRVKENISERNREFYEAHHAKFIENMQKRLQSLKPDEYSLSKTLPPENDLPNVSIVTVTYNRRIFMPLAKYSYMIQSYPESKLEWVIVDDGDDPIEDTLIGVSNVKYIRLEKKTSIGEKRNLGVYSAMYDTIVMMDDDDVYPNNSILHRVAMLYKEPRKQCVFCTTIPCYDIQKHISFMNVPPYNLSMSERASEATLAFTKDFWEKRTFKDIQIAEGNTFIHGREEMCREISPQEVIVSLVHSKNTSSRKVPPGEPNGCHYGFNEQLFAVVSEIGEQLNTSSQTETGGASLTSPETSGDGDHPSSLQT
jgi:hypothetical protein